MTLCSTEVHITMCKYMYVQGLDLSVYIHILAVELFWWPSLRVFGVTLVATKMSSGVQGRHLRRGLWPGMRHQVSNFSVTLVLELEKIAKASALNLKPQIWNIYSKHYSNRGFRTSIYNCCLTNPNEMIKTHKFCFCCRRSLALRLEW